MTDKQVKRFFEGYTKHKNAVVHPAGEEIPTSPKEWTYKGYYPVSYQGGYAINTNNIALCWKEETNGNARYRYTIVTRRFGTNSSCAYIPTLSNESAVRILKVIGPAGEDMPTTQGYLYKTTEKWVTNSDGTITHYPATDSKYSIDYWQGLGDCRELGTEIGFTIGQVFHEGGWTALVPLAPHFDKDAEKPAYDIWPHRPFVKKWYDSVDALVKSCPDSDGSYVNGINTNYFNRWCSSIDSSATIKYIDYSGNISETSPGGTSPSTPQAFYGSTIIKIGNFTGQIIGAINSGYTQGFEYGYERDGHSIKVKVITLIRSKVSMAHTQDRRWSDPTARTPLALGYDGLGVYRIETWEGYVE